MPAMELQQSTPLSIELEGVKMKEPLLNTVSLISMAATAAMALIAWGLAVYQHRKFKTPSVDKWVLFWLWWDVMIHFFIEGPFCVLSLIGTVESSKHWTALLWKEYGKADSRWLVSDPTIVALELLTVGFVGPLCLWLIYAICNDTTYRHCIQIILCTCELYGGWMTFVPDILVGSPSLSTDNWLYLWVYLIFYNGIWVVVPLALIYQSCQDMMTFEECPWSNEVKRRPSTRSTTEVTTKVKTKYN